MARAAEARVERRGPALHAYALRRLDRYAGSERDSARENTRREYPRLRSTFARPYFDREVRVRDLHRAAVQVLFDWLTNRPGREGRRAMDFRASPDLY